MPASGDRPGLALAGRARSRSETRAISATRITDPGTESDTSPSQDLESAGDSGLEARPQRASRLHLLCPGCNKPFADPTSLRRHRSAWRTADPACRNAAAHKRPRTVRRDVDSARDSDADDRIRMMMGDGSDSGLAARDAQSPFLQPRDEVGPGPASASDRRSNSARRCQRFTQCLQLVYIRFTLHTIRFMVSLHMVC
jgi:hypothetical protein